MTHGICQAINYREKNIIMKTIIFLYPRKIFVSTCLLFTLTSIVHAQGTGVLDPGFGDNGKVLSKIGANRDDISQSVAVTPDNKIIVSGNSFNSIGYSNTGVIRYKQNGKPEGTRIINDVFANVVLVQPDNKIVLGGAVAVGSVAVFDVWRLNSDGTTDSTFGNGGSQKIPFNNGSVICYAMTIQPNGKILIGGSTDVNGSYSNLVMARLNTDGSLDNSFGVGGKFSKTLSFRSLSCQKILVQPNGNIIAAGQYDTIINFEFFHHYMYALRLTNRGAIDSSFGKNGWVRYGNTSNDYCYSAGLLPDSRIILAGFSESGTSRPASVLCLKKNGAVDKSFGTNGWQYITFPGGSAIANATCIQQNGKPVLAGSTTFAGGTQAVFLARLNTNGTLDSSFANNGKDTFFTSTSGVGCNDAVLQADGKIVITGYQGPSHYYYLTARFLNDQQLVKNVTNDGFLSMPGDKDVQTNIAISPNPANDYVHIKGSGLSEGKNVITVFDNNGRAFIQQTVNGASIDLRLAVRTLTPGIYTCKIDAGKNVYQLKFVKE
jgi:uncharacterized delta-60 repeat protein